MNRSKASTSALVVVALGLTAPGCVPDLEALTGGGGQVDAPSDQSRSDVVSDGAGKDMAAPDASEDVADVEGLDGAGGSDLDASDTGGMDAGDVVEVPLDGGVLCPSCVGLALYWRFDEPYGTMAFDSSGNNRHGLYTALVSGAPAPSTLTPPVGFSDPRSRVFTIAGDQGQGVKYANIPPALKPPNNLTISLWYRSLAVDSQGGELLSAGDQYLIRASAGKLDWAKKNAASSSSYGHCYVLSAAVLDGHWHHVAAVTSTAGMALYFDGVAQSTTDGTDISYTLGPDLWVGRHGMTKTTYDFDGNIDEVRVYTRALSGAEVQALFHGAASEITDAGIVDSGPKDTGPETGPDGGGFEAGVPQMSYGEAGAAWPIPGTIEAENYDIGGQLVSYYDTTVGNTLGEYRTGGNEDVDIVGCGSGCYAVERVVATEWIEYTVNVATAGNYKVSLNVAAVANKRLHIEMDGVNVTGTLLAASTGSNTTFQEQNPTAIFALTAGQKVMRIVFEDDGLNLNWVKFSLQ